jgi:hypothetical protein
MIIQNAPSNVLSSAGTLGEKKGFKINANAHAFKMLSSGLYSDKVAAVLREVGCNAADAHIMLGNADQPIEVKIPNAIDTNMYIRDFGPGLSHEDILGLYTTYFASTKQSSNDFTGAFGLGSKSPFSYTDSFTVTSVHGGKKRTYSAHLDVGGAPSIVLLDESEADVTWPHGLQVGFPVNIEDIPEFRKKAQTVFAAFRVTPTILGSEPITHPTVITSGKRWKVEAHDEHTHASSCIVQMGNVRYPVTVNELRKAAKSSEIVKAYLSSFYSNFTYNSDYALILDVNIGDVEVAASREVLQYSPPTVAKLIDCLHNALIDMAKVVAEGALAMQTMNWEERCTLAAERTAIGGIVTIRLNTLMEAGYLKDDATKIVDLLNRRARMNDRLNTSKHRVVYITESGSRKFTVSKNEYDAVHGLSIPYAVDTKLAYGDSGGIFNRGREAILKKDVKNLLLVYPRGNEKPTAKETEALLNAIDSQLGAMTRIKQEDLPKPPAAVRFKKGSAPAPLPSEQVDTISGATVNLSTTSLRVYIPVSRRSAWGSMKYQYEVGGEFRNNWSFISMRDNMSNLKKDGLYVDAVYLTPGQIKKFHMAERTDWRNFSDVLKEKLSDSAIQQSLVGSLVKRKETYFLGYRNHGDPGLIMNLAFMRLHKEYVEAVDAAEKVLLETMPDVGKRIKYIADNSTTDYSRATNVARNERVNSYNNLCQLFGSSQLDLNDKTKVLVDLTGITALDSLEYGDITSIAAISKGALAAVIKSVISDNEKD